jgi:hypothetical protein
MAVQPVVTPGNLDADFRFVGGKIVNDSLVGGNDSVPSTPPVAPQKSWLYINVITGQITHYWVPVIAQWVAFAQSPYNNGGLTVTSAELSAAGQLPPNTTLYIESIGLRVSPLTLPTQGRYIGDMLIFQKNHPTNTTIRRANTGQPSDKIVTAAEKGAAWIWNGIAWLGISQSIA